MGTTKKLKLPIPVLLSLVVIIAYACTNSSGKAEKTDGISTTDKKQPGDEVTVIQKWDMPSELREISGLSYLDENRLVCVQDEVGKVYIYNTSTEKIEREILFNARGDYEGLAVVGKDIWVLRADGALFELKNFQASNPVVNEYKTPLTIQQDCEGLCYDSSANRLLLTVKEKDPNSNDYKGIYGFDLTSHTMVLDPVYKIDLTDAVFSGAQSDKKKKKGGTIMPSAIAIHPSSHELYITDGPKSRLLVINANGSIKKLVQLDKEVFPQPEGIIFNTKGDLFISNEGPKEPGNILQVQLEDAQ